MTSPATLDLGTLTLDVSTPSHTKTPTSPLLSIPRELRDEIYAYLLRCGDLAILRTSRQIGHEARERLYREGVTRIKLGFPDDGDGGFAFQQRWESVQHFHFRLFLRPEETRPRKTVQSCVMFGQLIDFARLKESSSLKRDCLISIEDDHSIPQTPLFHEVCKMKELFAEITRFTLCIRFIEGFSPRPTESCCLCDVFFGMEHEHDEHLDIADKSLIVENLHTLKERLEPILGLAGFVGDTEVALLQSMWRRKRLHRLMAKKQ